MLLSPQQYYHYIFLTKITNVIKTQKPELSQVWATWASHSC